MNIVDAVVEAIRLAVTTIPEDTIKALRLALRSENEELARFNLRNMLRSADIGRRKGIPVCQDTGIITFFVEAGISSPYLGSIERILIEGTRIATKKVPLRPNAVDVLTDRNSGNNVGRYVPVIHLSLTEGNRIRVGILPKGGGSENCSMLRMLNPSDGWDGLRREVIRRVKECGGRPCPPVILGIGVGGTVETAVMLAKRVLLRKVGERSSDSRIAKIEEGLLKEINELGVGPMGMGGKTTALDVKIDVAHRHPASFPVAVVFQCWANRRSFIDITAEGDVRIWQ